VVHATDCRTALALPCRMVLEQCPVCGSHELVPVAREALVQADAGPRRVSTILSVWCAKGHWLFMREAEPAPIRTALR